MKKALAACLVIFTVLINCEVKEKEDFVLVNETVKEREKGIIKTTNYKAVVVRDKKDEKKMKDYGDNIKSKTGEFVIIVFYTNRSKAIPVKKLLIEYDEKKLRKEVEPYIVGVYIKGLGKSRFLKTDDKDYQNMFYVD